MKTNDFSLFTSLMLVVACTAWACDDDKSSDGGGGAPGAATDGDDGSSTGGSDSGLGGAGGDTAQTGGNGGTGGGDAEPTCFPPPDSIEYWWDQESSDLNYQIGERLHDEHLEIVAPAGYGFSSPFIGAAATFSAQITAYSNSPVLHGGDSWPTTSIEFWFSSYNESSNMASWLGAWGLTLDEGRVRLSYETDVEGPEASQLLELITEEDGYVDETFDADLEFHHVAVVNDVEAVEARLYVDGKLAGTLDFVDELDLDEEDARAVFEDMLDNLGAFEVGGNSYGVWMSGYVDEISLYSEMLTPAEIKGIFDAGSLGKCTD